MKLMPRLVLILLLSIFFADFNYAAVGVSVGGRAGLDISQLRKYTAPAGYKKQATLGSDLAAVLRIDFNKYVALQTEIEFIQKGQSYKNRIDSAKFVAKSVLNYVQFPILVVGRVGNDKVKGSFAFGPYFAYWAGGYAQSAISVDKQTRTSTTTTHTFTAQDMRFDAGIITGAGVEVKAGKGWVQIGVRHNLGLVGVNKNTPSIPKMYNSNFTLSLGYLYTIK